MPTIKFQNTHWYLPQANFSITIGSLGSTYGSFGTGDWVHIKFALTVYKEQIKKKNKEGNRHNFDSLTTLKRSPYFEASACKY